MTNSTDNIDYATLLAEAIFELKHLRTQLDTVEQQQHEPIAVIGVGCRLPGGADTAAAFWQLLAQGIDAISEVPPDRWDIDAFYDPDPSAPGKMSTRWSGFLQQVDQFDPHFFGIAPREAAWMDPQQRLVMECTWEALEQAGLPTERLAASPTGVFIGACDSDYHHLQYHDIQAIDIYNGTGSANNIIAGRLSYLLNLQGPCMVVDTACSSSLVAVHLAVQSLRAGECSLALAGGVNVLLMPENYVGASKMHMMAADGRCKTFDARADGFVRGEGCGMIVLKRLSDAQRDGDAILALIRGSAVNQDGKSAGLTTPNLLAQQAVIRAALQNAQVAPHEVGYVEAHGTGTSLGDPIEIEALTATYGQPRPDGQVCWVGAVKTNMGHLEGAAGIAGLIKTVLTLQHGQIPPNLHLRTLNPHISLAGTPLALPDRLQPWQSGSQPRRAAVSSFGWSGTNAHIVLEQAPAPAAAPVASPAPSDAPVLVPLSARSAGALQALAAAYAARLRAADAPALTDLAYTASHRRNHYDERLALVGRSTAELAEQLEAWQAGESISGSSGTAPGNPPALVWVFPGHGAQWRGMGRQLLSDPVAGPLLEACAVAFRSEVEWDLRAVLAGEAPDPLYERVDVVQPALFAVMIGLAARLRAWGLQPDALVGHSQGEVAAAYVAGALSLADAARIICYRSKLMQRTSGQGAMAQIELPADEASALIAQWGQQLAVAVVNSPRATVISGAPAALDELRAELDARGISHRKVRLNVASHSAQMDALLPELRAGLAGLRPQASSLPLYSTVDQRVLQGAELDANYWCRNLRQTVQFRWAVAALAARGPTVFVELSPHPVLTLPMTEELAGQASRVISTLRREQDVPMQLWRALGQLYCAGVPLGWRAIAPQGQLVDLPTYPWQRERCWSVVRPGTPVSVSRVASDEHPLLATHSQPAIQPGLECWEAELSTALLPYLTDHRVQERVVLPGAAYLDLALAGARRGFGSTEVRLEAVSLEQPLLLDDTAAHTIQLLLQHQGDQTAHFTISSRPREAASSTGWTRHAQGQIRRGLPAAEPPQALAELRASCPEPIDPADYYANLAAQGLGYGASFQGIAAIWRRDGAALAQLVATPAVRRGAAAYSIHPALLDACFQALAATAPRDDRSGASDTFVPVAVEQFQVLAVPQGELWGYAQLDQSTVSDQQFRRGDLLLLDASGQLVASARGLQLQRLQQPASDPVADWLYLLDWEAQPLEQAETPAKPQGWLLLEDASGAGAALAAQLAARGGRAVRVTIGSSYRQLASDRYQLAPDDASGFRQLLSDAFGASGAVCQGVAYLWGLDAPAEPEAGICTGALHLVQALAQAGWRDQPRLWLITRGAQGTGDGAIQVAQAALWGFGGSVVHEQPRLRCARLDLSPLPYADEYAQLCDELLANTAEDQIALRSRGRLVARLERQRGERATPAVALTPAGERPFQLELERPGVLEHLQLRAIAARQPGAGEVTIAVESAGLNFLDLLGALGIRPDQDGKPLLLGSECAGVITAVGPDVRGLAVGDPVIAMGSGCFGSDVIVPAEFVAPKPAQLSFVEAGGIATVFCTAYYSLHVQARLQPGERVLIHSAAGGTGLAALQIARWCGAEVFATAGTAEKRDFLRSLGVSHVYDSRTLEFADAILRDTNGAGVDVVLNSLSGEAIPRSLELLGMNGRYVEIGKKDIYQDTRLGLSPFRRSLAFFAVDLAGLASSRPERLGQTLREVVALFASGQLTPSPTEAFPIARAVEAFHRLAQGRQIGKLVVTLEQRASTPIAPARASGGPIVANGSYLITGGLGGLGLQVAQWLVAQGARHLALVGRRKPSAQAELVLEALAEAGATVQVHSADIGDPAQVERVLDLLASQLPPLRGVFHCAAVLDDGVLLQQTPERFSGVYSPKAAGAWHLHQYTAGLALDHFVLFSSVAALLGSPGQGNYAAANAMLDALAHARQSAGLAGLSINWGPWAEVGLAAQGGRNDRLSYQGMDSITPELGLEALGRLMRQPLPQLAVLPLNLRQWRQYFPKVAQLPLLLRLSDDTSRPADRGGMRATLSAATPEGRAALLEQHLREQLARVMRLPIERIERETPLGSLGLDSLMALEFRNRLEDSLELSFAVTLIWNYQTIAALAGYLLERLGQASQPEQPASTEPPAATPAQPDLSDEQAADLAALLGALDQLSVDDLHLL